jgi:hypothetical protein
MAFHDLASLSPSAVQAVAQTCEALITAEGKEPSTPRERQLLATLFPALVGQPWPAQQAATLPLGLSGLVLTNRQRQEVMQLLTLLERIAAELQVEADVVADLEEVCSGHVLKAFGDMYRRTFQSFNNDGVVRGYARFILPMLGVDIDREHESHYAALGTAPAGSLGAGLHDYYQHNGFPFPGSRKGLFPDHALLIALPALLQFQMGIADPLAGSVAPKLKDQRDAPAFARALQRGASTTGPIRDFHWDF